MKELTIQSCLNHIDTFDIISEESYLQNDERVVPQIGYFVKKNKDLIGKSVFENKEFLDNFTLYTEYVGKKVEIKKNNITKTKKGGVIVYDEAKLKSQTSELDYKYNNVIEKHKTFLKTKVSLSNDFHKISLVYLPNLKQKTMNFLVEAKLILE